MRTNLSSLAAASSSLLLALLGGCGKPPGADVIDVVFDPCEPLVLVPADGTSDEHIETIHEAMAMWNEAADAQLTLEEVEGAPRLPVRFERAAPAFHGFYDDVEASIFINTELEDDHQRTITLAHEIGHAFGLYHVKKDERPSIMNNGNLRTRIQSEDVAALREVWGACAAEAAEGAK